MRAPWSLNYLDGKQLADQIRQQIGQRVAVLSLRARPPVLAAVLPGQDPGAALYADKRRKKCQELGIGYRLGRQARHAGRR